VKTDEADIIVGACCRPSDQEEKVDQPLWREVIAASHL